MRKCPDPQTGDKKNCMYLGSDDYCYADIPMLCPLKITWKISNMIIEVAIISHESYTPLLFEVSELSYEEVKKSVFEAFRDAHRRLIERWKNSYKRGETDIYTSPDAEAVILSEEFTEEMKKRGFRRLKGRMSFVFWAWNSLKDFWEDDSDDIDRELWEFVKEGE